MTPERLVFDCNVLISAALVAGGTPARALDAAIERHLLLLSEPTYDELVTRLSRDKFRRYLDIETSSKFLEALADAADWIEIEHSPLGCRDPDDDKYLETAQRGRADAIVTGDRDLLVMHPFEGIAILTPADWIER